MAESVIALANKRVPITMSCRIAGTEIPDGLEATKSLKVRCPFGEIYHDDGGAEAAFRVYPGPNNAWCFACGEFYTPVRLAAVAWDVTQEQAAIQLLERINYKPASYAHHWAGLQRPDPPDVAALAQALQFYCGRISPDFDSRRQEERVADFLARCLGLIGRVATEAEAETWLATTKQVMAEILGEN